MTIVDPRDRGDVLTTASREQIDGDRFADALDSEPVQSGWVVVALTFDPAGRVLLIEEPWADGWLAPGGACKPGESLDAAVKREIDEETGVEASPVAPRAVDEFTFEHERTGETIGWTLVCFEAIADDPTIDRDPSVDDEEITDIRWFEHLPENVFNPDLMVSAYEQCVNGP